MKRKQLVIVLALTGFVCSCKKTDPNENKYGITKTAAIQVDNGPATVSIPDVIDLVVPQRAFSGSATINIVTLDPAKLPVSSDFELFESFDVTSTSGSSFARDLEISIKYDPAKGKKGAINNGAAYYDETAKKWIPFRDVVVDSIDSEIHIKTNHLCKLARLSYTRTLGYTDWSSSLHFNYYWTEPEILTNAEYKSPYSAVNTGTDPWYIQDIQFYLEQAYEAYKKANLSLPEGKINVYLKDLGSDDGATSYLGNISINQKIVDTNDGYAKTAEILPMACAHELLHYVQDYYYMQAFSEYTIKWWLEATAVQADRFVWPQNKKFDALYYGQNLYQNLTKSWDDCNSDPEYYIAGSFLSYLINYRSGTKLSLPEIIIEGGDATDISFIRTILDNHIKTKMGSPGIGAEFADFIKWAIEAKSDIRLMPSPPTPTPAYPNFNNLIFTNRDQQEVKSVTVPHLAATFFKALNKTGEKQTISAKIDTKSDDITALAYKMRDDGSVTFIRELNASDSVLVDLADDKEWIEIVGINKNKDAAGTIAASFKLKQQIKQFFFSCSVRCNYLRKYSDGSKDTGTNNYNLHFGSLPCVQQGDTIKAEWNSIIEGVPQSGRAKFIIQKDNSLTFEITNEANYSVAITTSIIKGTGMPRKSASGTALQYVVNESSTVLTQAYFKSVFSSFSEETTGIAPDARYPQMFQVFFYY